KGLSLFAFRTSAGSSLAGSPDGCFGVKVVIRHRCRRSFRVQCAPVCNRAAKPPIGKAT
ncbi:hypothetical protein HMPREF9371_0513, partial [Neisseria shayeganii 871]